MDKKQALQQTFDTVAKGYDHPALAFFPETARRMIKHLNLSQSQSIRLLDVCTGTGVVALEASSQNPNAHIVGIDLSQGMLRQAQSKANQQKLKNIQFTQMDLDQLNFPDHHFDVSTCSFGLFFLDDMQQALKNITSKVTPNGKVTISTFSEGAFDPMSTLFLQRYAALGYEVPPLSWKQMTTDEQISKLFSDIGISNVTLYREPLGFHMSSANDWWDVVWNAGYRGLLTKMSKAELAGFKELHLQEVQRLINQGETWLDTGVVIAVADI